MKKIFLFCFNKYQSATHVSTCIFQGLFKNIVFRSVALVTKKLWAILDFFFTDPSLFRVKDGWNITSFKRQIK